MRSARLPKLILSILSIFVVSNSAEAFNVLPCTSENVQDSMLTAFRSAGGPQSVKVVISRDKDVEKKWCQRAWKTFPQYAAFFGKYLHDLRVESKELNDFLASRESSNYPFMTELARQRLIDIKPALQAQTVSIYSHDFFETVWTNHAEIRNGTIAMNVHFFYDIGAGGGWRYMNPSEISCPGNGYPVIRQSIDCLRKQLP